MGSPPPGVPPGDDAQDGAIRIFGVISVLSDSRRFGNALPTRRKLLSGDDGDPPNHQPPITPDPVEFLRAISSALDVFRWSILKLGMLNGGTCMLSDENWCLSGRWRSGDGIDRLSSFSLFRCCRSMWSSISCKTCGKRREYTKISNFNHVQYSREFKINYYEKIYEYLQ